MQRGYIYRHRNSWLLRYYEWELDAATGQPKRTQRCVRLAPYNADYPNKRAVELLADKHLAPINSKIVTPEGAMAVSTFIDKFYLPHCERELRPATVKSYKDIFRIHLKDKLADIRLRDFRTVHAQRLMRQITGVGHRTLLHIKSFLSGVFKYAKREGLLDGVNPVMDVSVPGKAGYGKGPAYTVSEIEDIIFELRGTARSVVTVAAFTGLRSSEIRGLRVEDFDGECIRVARSVWRTHVGETKTASSRALVPLIPLLVPLLKKLTDGRAAHEYIFAGERKGAPLNLENLATRVVKPALVKKNLPWKGWHAFRRGLGSNLYQLGVKPVVIQSILRHSDVATTLGYYVVTPSSDAHDALKQLEAIIWVGDKVND
jgi:integrase